MIHWNITLLFMIFDIINISLFVTNLYVRANKIIKLEQEVNKFNVLTPNDRTKRKVLIEHPNKWTLPIYYNLLKPVSSDLVALALSKISKETCIKFEKRKKLPFDGPGILYYWTGECKSFVGKQANKHWQGITLGKECYNIGGIIHETLHALGLFHEHSRYDSEKYVKLHKQNMVENSEGDVDPLSFLNSYDYFLNYDYGSIMHYGLFVCSKNGQKTIVPIDPNYAKTIGHVERLSFIDIKTLNLHYCSNICTNRIKCANHGYQDPKNCKVCKCVEGFSGRFCEKYTKPRKGCGSTKIVLGGQLRKLYLNGRKYCVYHIKTIPNGKIILRVANLYMYPNTDSVCSHYNTLEINYQVDKSVTGARFCSRDRPNVIVSHNNYVIVYYRSNSNTNYAYLLFGAAVDRKSSKVPRRRIKSV